MSACHMGLVAIAPLPLRMARGKAWEIFAPFREKNILLLSDGCRDFFNPIFPTSILSVKWVRLLLVSNMLVTSQAQAFSQRIGGFVMSQRVEQGQPPLQAQGGGHTTRL